MNRAAIMQAARRALLIATAKTVDIATCMDESIELPDTFSGIILNFSLREGEELLRDEENKREK